MRASLFLVAVTGLFAGCSGPAPPPFKPIVDMRLLCQTMIDPNASIIWDSVKTINTTAGDQTIRPKSEEDWTAIRNAAVTLAESGNLMMMAPRAKNGDDWMKKAQELIDTGQAAMRAAEQKNADNLFTVGGDIYDACSHCHAKYNDAIANANK
jgi:hypothetical protein